MSLLRDPALVAVNDVMVQCQTNARHHRYTAEVIDDAAVAGVLQRLAGDREALADRLALGLRSHGELPQAADGELDSLHELGDRLIARFAERGAGRLLRERGDDERRLAAAAKRALDEAVPGDLRPQFEHLVTEANAAADDLIARIETLS
ncbi:hypothetical protein NYO91_05165 [Arhodomonas aquaeolei]|uniref:hypothetical protein n=1 Tax=Arhodomonas TaxID=2368 RepID=UPI0013D2310F|nr:MULTISPECIES: hypothetical protein [Arhodomonas]MCS4503466.1 hypothetical protein [Arhodomonas aquaeolei]